MFLFSSELFYFQRKHRDIISLLRTAGKLVNLVRDFTVPG